MQEQGHLQKKETALDANFLHEVFGEALGYKTATQSPEAYQQQAAISRSPVVNSPTGLWRFLPRLDDGTRGRDRVEGRGRRP